MIALLEVKRRSSQTISPRVLNINDLIAANTETSKREEGAPREGGHAEAVPNSSQMMPVKEPKGSKASKVAFSSDTMDSSQKPRGGKGPKSKGSAYAGPTRTSLVISNYSTNFRVSQRGKR